MSTKEQVELYRQQAQSSRELAATTPYGGEADKARRSADAYDRLADKLEEAMKYGQR